MTVSNSDSAETSRLLQQLEHGDRGAFDLLFMRHRATILKLAERRLDARLRARLDPSDIVQETHLEATRLLDDFLARRPMSFSLWLIKTAHQRVTKAQRHHLDAAKRSVKREYRLPDGSSLHLARRIAGTGPSPTSHCGRHEQAQRVRQALAQLKDIEREVVLLRIFEGLTSREVACVLDVTPEAAQKRYARGLLKLRVFLQERP